MFVPLILLGIFVLTYVTADTPAFQASPSIAANTSFILSAANKVISKHPSHDIAGTYLIGIGATQKADVYTTWPNAIFFEAGMNIDCDGIDWQCPYRPTRMTLIDSGNTDGQPQTDWGNLSAYQVPYIVVPDSAVQKLNIPENAISVVICAGQMFYAIMGDTNGNDPQVIGEASWLMGQTCFPDAGLNGGVGYDNTDVLCASPRSTRTNDRHCIYDGVYGSQ